MAKIQNAEVIDLSKYNGRFVRVQGKIKKKHKRMKKGLPVISFENQRNWLGLQKIRKGDLLQIEGFATIWPGVACVKVAVSTFYQHQIYIMPLDFQNREEPPIVARFVFWVNP